MKGFSLSFLFVLIFSAAQSQEISPRIYLNLSFLKAADNLNANYSYYTDFSQNSDDTKAILRKSIHSFYTLEMDDSCYSRIFIGHDDMKIVRHVRIKNKKTGQLMDLFVRFNHRLFFGEKIYFENLKFDTGIFFYDMCNQSKYFISNKKQIDSKRPNLIDFQDKQNHKVKLSELLKYSGLNNQCK